MKRNIQSVVQLEGKRSDGMIAAELIYCIKHEIDIDYVRVTFGKAKITLYFNQKTGSIEVHHEI
jgi:hypothetical protein